MLLVLDFLILQVTSIPMVEEPQGIQSLPIPMTEEPSPNLNLNVDS